MSRSEHTGHMGNGVHVVTMGIVRNEAGQTGGTNLGISCLSFVSEKALKRIPSDQDSSSYGRRRE